MNTIIRKIRPEEHDLLREFLYQAIYLPEGVEPPPRSVVDLPELQVYIADFGTRPVDHGLVAEVEKKVIGAAWCRIMADYGHIDNDTPSLAISLLPEYRGLGIGSFPKLKKLPKTHAYITSNMKIKDLLEVSLWLRIIPNAVITISLTSDWHTREHRPLANMAECVERSWSRTNRCFLTIWS